MRIAVPGSRLWSCRLTTTPERRFSAVPRPAPPTRGWGRRARSRPISSGSATCATSGRRGGKLIQGEPYDTVILGLSTAGLALTGLTVAALLPSGGTSLAAKAPVTRGLSLLKGARRAGFLSRELIEKMGASRLRPWTRPRSGKPLRRARLRPSRDAVGGAAGAPAGRRPHDLGHGQDVVALEARIGQRGAAQVLGVARNAGELGRARRLAEAMGRRTRATLKLLGTAALVLGTSWGCCFKPSGSPRDGW